MKYLCYFVLVFVVGSCDHCRDIDCYEAGLDLRFRVIDSSGKDLVYDLNVSIDSLHFETVQKERQSIEKFEAIDKSLTVHLSPDILTYVLSYDGITTQIALSTEIVNEGPCCGTLYGTSLVTTSTGRAPIEFSTSGHEKIHIISL